MKASRLLWMVAFAFAAAAYFSHLSARLPACLPASLFVHVLFACTLHTSTPDRRSQNVNIFEDGLTLEKNTSKEKKARNTADR